MKPRKLASCRYRASATTAKAGDLRRKVAPEWRHKSRHFPQKPYTPDEKFVHPFAQRRIVITLSLIRFGWGAAGAL
jgi:hypothetical protein